MVQLNPKASNLLKDISQNNGDSVYACIKSLDDSGIEFPFLISPTSLNISSGASYAQIATSGTNVPRQYFSYGMPKVMNINGAIFTTQKLDKSLQPLLDYLENLVHSKPSNNKYRADFISFNWGSRIFKPAVVTSYSYVEQLWSYGEPVFASLDMTLLEVSDNQVNPTTITSTSTDDANFTERQVRDGIISAKSSLPASFTTYNVDFDPITNVFNVVDGNGIVLRELGGLNSLGKFIPIID